MNIYDSIIIDEVNKKDRLPKLNLDEKVIVSPITEIMSLYSGKIQQGCNKPIGFLWKINVDVLKYNPEKEGFRKIKQPYSILTSSIRLVSELVELARNNDNSLTGLVFSIEKIEKNNKTDFKILKLSDSYKKYISENK